MGDMVWYPRASDRNTLESALNLFDTIRKQVFDTKKEVGDPLRYFTALEFSRIEDKRFFERIADRGVLRKVGHIVDLYANGPAVLFQTKSPVVR